MMTDKKHESITAAMAAFQADLPKVGKNSINPHFKSKYASLEDITEIVLPALGRHGLAYFATPRISEHGFVLAGAIRHESGGEVTGEWPLPDGGQPQALGSALTYARRYLLTAMTGVAPDEDDDGNAAQNTTRTQPKPAPEGWQELVKNATTLDDLGKVHMRATAEGWWSATVQAALTARKEALGS